MALDFKQICPIFRLENKPSPGAKRKIEDKTKSSLQIGVWKYENKKL